jgi:hypothetical protein
MGRPWTATAETTSSEVLFEEGDFHRSIRVSPGMREERTDQAPLSSSETVNLGYTMTGSSRWSYRMAKGRR